MISCGMTADLLPGPSACLLWAVSEKCPLRKSGTAAGLRKRAAVNVAHRQALAEALPQSCCTMCGLAGMEWVVEVLLKVVTIVSLADSGIGQYFIDSCLFINDLVCSTNALMH